MMTFYALGMTKKLYLTVKLQYFNVFRLIRPKNGIECFRKYPKTASNQLMPEYKSCSSIKKRLILRNKEKYIFTFLGSFGPKTVLSA